MSKLMRLKSSIVGLPTDLSNLNTAITDEVARASGVEGVIGDMTTTATNLVGAINEHDAEIGDLSGMTTTATDLVGAINEHDAEIGDVSALTTTSKVVAGAINEHDAEIGDVSALTTTSKVVAGAINEVNAAKLAKASNLSDLADVAAARTNLVVYSKSEVDSAISAANLNLGTNYSVADITARDALTGLTVGDVVFVVDDGDTKWASYKVDAVNAGVATFIKVMDQDIYLNSISKEAIKSAYESNDDTNAYTDADKATVGYISITAARDLDKLIQSDELNTSITLAGASDTDIASSLAVKTYVDNQDALKLTIASNLSDLANVATARTNLNVYSKTEVDSAIGGQANKMKNDSAVIAAGKIVFSAKPVDGLAGIANGVIRVFGVEPTNPAAYDEVEVSIDSSDATGKTFNVNSDVAGEYDGKTAKAFIMYNPAA